MQAGALKGILSQDHPIEREAQILRCLEYDSKGIRKLRWHIIEIVTATVFCTIILYKCVNKWGDGLKNLKFPLTSFVYDP